MKPHQLRARLVFERGAATRAAKASNHWPSASHHWGKAGGLALAISLLDQNDIHLDPRPACDVRPIYFDEVSSFVVDAPDSEEQIARAMLVFARSYAAHFRGNRTRERLARELGAAADGARVAGHLVAANMLLLMARRYAKNRQWWQREAGSDE